MFAIRQFVLLILGSRIFLCILLLTGRKRLIHLVVSVFKRNAGKNSELRKRGSLRSIHHWNFSKSLLNALYSGSLFIYFSINCKIVIKHFHNFPIRKIYLKLKRTSTEIYKLVAIVYMHIRGAQHY